MGSGGVTQLPICASCVCCVGAQGKPRLLNVLIYRPSQDALELEASTLCNENCHNIFLTVFHNTQPSPPPRSLYMLFTIMLGLSRSLFWIWSRNQNPSRVIPGCLKAKWPRILRGIDKSHFKLSLQQQKNTNNKNNNKMGIVARLWHVSLGDFLIIQLPRGKTFCLPLATKFCN